MLMCCEAKDQTFNGCCDDKFLQCCIICRCGLVMRILSVRLSLSVHQTRQSCKAFIGLTIHAKMIGRGHPLLPEILGQTDRVGDE